jgi:hypothetical protein
VLRRRGRRSEASGEDGTVKTRPRRGRRGRGRVLPYRMTRPCNRGPFLKEWKYLCNRRNIFIVDKQALFSKSETGEAFPLCK